MKYNPYSISKLNSFDGCPKKFKLNYIDKIKTEKKDSMALSRGTFIHLVLENNFNYGITDDRSDLNSVFTQKEKDSVIELMKKFRETEVGKHTESLINHKDSVLEEDFSFDNNLKLRNFFSKESWLRGSADLYNVKLTQPIIVDYKSGKDKSEDKDFGYEQGMVYAIYLFIKFPEVLSIKAVFVFVEHSTTKTIFYSRDELKSYLELFYNKTKKVETTTVFKEQISELCPYCDFNSTKFCSSYEDLKKETNKILESKISLDF